MVYTILPCQPLTTLQILSDDKERRSLVLGTTNMNVT